MASFQATPTPPTSRSRPVSELVSERIRRLRQARGLSRAALASGVGVSAMCVCGWEWGRLPSTPVLPRLASALEVSIDYLLLGREAGRRGPFLSVAAAAQFRERAMGA